MPVCSIEKENADQNIFELIFGSDVEACQADEADKHVVIAVEQGDSSSSGGKSMESGPPLANVTHAEDADQQFKRVEMPSTGQVNGVSPQREEATKED